jgi:hypothetical protein
VSDALYSSCILVISNEGRSTSVEQEGADCDCRVDLAVFSHIFAAHCCPETDASLQLKLEASHTSIMDFESMCTYSALETPVEWSLEVIYFTEVENSMMD